MKYKRPEIIKRLPRVSQEDIIQQKQQPFAERALAGVGQFTKGALQGWARSFIGVGAEISERIMNPMWEEQARFGEATFTPKEDWQKKLFGTDKPISIKSVGDEMLAIGGEDFQKEWGMMAVPLGLAISAIDVTPIGFGKKDAARAAAKTISKTDDIASITRATKPLFPNATDDVVRGISRSFVGLSDEKAVYDTLTKIGTLNKPVKVAGRTTPKLKDGADMSLFRYSDYIDGITRQKPNSVSNIEAAISRTKRLHTQGKLNKREYNRIVRNLNDELFSVAKKEGFSTRITKNGTVRLARRESGNFVSDDLMKHPIKDIRAGSFGGTKDITRMMQEADGSLTVAQRAARGSAGPLERDVLRRTQDMMDMRSQWIGEQQQRLLNIADKITDKDAITANKVLAKLTQPDIGKPTKELLQRKEIAELTKNDKVVEFAKQARRYLDETLDAQNHFRKVRGQEPIKRRARYTPEQIKKDSLWANAMGFDKEPRHIMRPELPDFIKPDKPFIGHDLARKANMPEYLKEMNLKRLLENYTNAAARDIFNTSIIQNNKAHAQVLESVGKPGTARAIQDWTAESFAGIKAGLDRQAALRPTIEKGMKWWRQGLVKGVFPLNFAWNSFVQTSSAVLTTTRHGVRNSIAAGFEWATNPKSRKWVEDNAHSYITKTNKAGKITRQDINKGMAEAARINKKPLDSAVDAANFFTETVERNLTGWSVLAAKRDGARRGLKGDSLKWFASDGGAKTQSMYNLEDLPGMLRNEIVKTGAPFNTFSFEAFNTLREFAGKTGVPPSTFQERMKWILRFMGGATAVNYVSNAAIGREPWEASSFIPFYSILGAPIESRLTGDWSSTASTRHLPSPVGIGAQFGEGIHNYIAKGDTKKLRQASVRYLPGLFGIPGGTQVNRTIDGLMAIADEGVKDSAGRMLFPITEEKEKIQAVFAGPWATPGGKEYWESREKNIWDLFKDEEDEEPIKKRTEQRGYQRPNIDVLRDL